MKLSYRNEKNARYISAMHNKSLDNPDWYKIENSTDEEADILVYDYIGWPYNDSRDFVASIQALSQPKITIRINSPGGDVFDAHAIYNAIKNHPSKPVTRVESLAASAASYIFMAGSEKQAYKNAMIMIHEPLVYTYGNQHELRDTADLLNQINETLVEMYVENTGIGKRAVRDMLKAETWMNMSTAKEKGFVDKILDGNSTNNAKNSFDLSIYMNAPEGFCPKEEDGGEPTIRDIERVLRDVGGLSKNRAKAILARGWNSEVVENDDKAALIAAQNLLMKIKGK